ncbi:MAG: DUF3427 domain-containing protein [Candidatus Lokiarchaeota archaeon]|nr:DUF3427 domain-containing protein [Candidatus Lokiarchaeota archaeon]
MPKGLYEQILTDILNKKIEDLDKKYGHEKKSMDFEESSFELSLFLGKVIKKALDQITGSSTDKIRKQISISNKMIEFLSEKLEDKSFEGYKISSEADMLLSIYEKIEFQGKQNAKVPRPESPINQSSIFTGSSNIEPSLVSEWKKEIKSADRINLIVSFIKWSGVRLIIRELEEFTRGRENKLRIITTTYIGATQLKAIDKLSKLPNTEIKISYDTNRTRLHAKTYMFERDSGFGTAYIGSSNLSNVAISSGLEWNMKISEYENKEIFNKCIGTFETYWNDSEFKMYDPNQKEELKRAIQSAKISSNDFKKRIKKKLFEFDIKPYSFQKEILEELEAERIIHKRYKNLIVAATGTGKTVISAFDYKGFRKSKSKENRLLFVAHRQEILEQSIDCFKRVLKDENFGDLWVGNHRPEKGHADHLFISIQSFNSRSIHEMVEPDYFDFIIIDEFHHAAADSYQVILDYFTPKILLGLTATPERMDGKSIVDLYFDGYIAAEIRLREAINRKLLCPFQYFVVTDPIDLSNLTWSRGGYKIDDLEELYVAKKGKNRRARAILNATIDYVDNIKNVQGIGFCVSVKHAHFMADFFKNQGIPSIALDGTSPEDLRYSAKTKLNNKDINFIFVVDLYNEGIDIPDVNTVLFLRPTESLTIFLQQLGRGLRLSEGKDCLTVLDFVGQAHRNYNFSDKFRALVGKTRHSLKREIKKGFPHVPKGCFIEMEKQAQMYILENIRKAINNVTTIRSKIQKFPEITNLELTMENFLKYYGIEIWWLYKASSVKNKGWNRLCVQAGVRKEFKDKNPNERRIVKGIETLTLCNSRRFINFIIRCFDNISTIEDMDFSKEEILMLSMFHYTIWYKAPEKCGFKKYIDGLLRINENPVMKEELISVLKYQLTQIKFVDTELDLGFPCPLDLHCKYTTDQILAAMEYYNIKEKKSMREGVKYLEDRNCELLFVTLNKSEKDYSPSTMYHDYSINQKLFHWQSQSIISDHTPTGKRYVSNDDENYVPLLFVRKYKKEHGQTAPYYYLGPVKYKDHEGNKPINIIWELKHSMPPKLARESNKFTIT